MLCEEGIVFCRFCSKSRLFCKLHEKVITCRKLRIRLKQLPLKIGSNKNEDSMKPKAVLITQAMLSLQRFPNHRFNFRGPVL